MQTVYGLFLFWVLSEVLVTHHSNKKMQQKIAQNSPTAPAGSPVVLSQNPLFLQYPLLTAVSCN